MYEIAGRLFHLPNLVIFIVVYTINTVILFIKITFIILRVLFRSIDTRVFKVQTYC